VSEQLERQGLLVLESSIPEDMTIDQWRRRPERRAGRRRGSRTPVSARHLLAIPETTCDHLHDTTTRYDRAEKILTFLLVCHVCGTEKVIEALPYEPRFEPLASDTAPMAA
jgi:hypothetical protein